jgi:hypothetical protein
MDLNAFGEMPVRQRSEVACTPDDVGQGSFFEVGILSAMARRGELPADAIVTDDVSPISTPQQFSLVK